ncbi:hypothetical protein [Phenylobacterium aquaticum]|jgi:hypothetical protein|uniref:hypothetical protein n=1 Tax=Phenylobacterium aquaticum TaxID=1763816 RepID=UPI001F5D4AF8|nr:hypothetical protein [Phenylobacterium aquaticum]MCI3131615.1 hypothetical protein [Phenylobacterium aquaticum]
MELAADHDFALSIQPADQGDWRADLVTSEGVKLSLGLFPSADVAQAVANRSALMSAQVIAALKRSRDRWV